MPDGKWQSLFAELKLRDGDADRLQGASGEHPRFIEVQAGMRLKRASGRTPEAERMSEERGALSDVEVNAYPQVQDKDGIHPGYEDRKFLMK